MSGSPDHPSDSPQGLLGAVLNNPHLRQQLRSMPPDAKTIELTTQTGDDFAHPDWPPPESRSAEMETVELSLPPQGSLPAWAGQAALPLRRVGSLTEQKRDDLDYRIIGRLGSGGTGIVYQAHQRAIDREVAIKMLRTELAVNEVSRERFLAEARVIGGLDHPNVIALHELYVNETGSLFYSMKRIDGTSWDRRIGEMTLNQNIETLLRVADAIRYAHSRGLVHRDIKPENVMLGRFGEVLLADWGLAVRPSGDAGSSTEMVDSAIGGTPAYMAPELALGDQQAVGFATDVYLIGATLFHILTGYPPHHGESLLACIQAAANNEIRPTRVEGELMDIAMRAMATRPEDRYPTVEAFIAAIDDQRQHEQSVRLLQRAKRRLESASQENRYESFRVADALIREAIEVWPENHRAHDALKQLQLDFARSAASHGDLDLALSLYELAGEGQCEAAVRVARLRDERNESDSRESRYSVLFTHSPDAGLLTQMSSGRIVEANEMFEHLLGYSEAELIGRPMSSLKIWACTKRRRLFVERLKRDRAVENFEALLVHKDGFTIETLISGRTTVIAGEELVVSTIRDISQRKAAENELKRSRQRLRDLQRLAGLGTWSYDVATSEWFWSAETYQLLGLSPEDGVPDPGHYLELLHPDDRERFQASLEAAIEQGTAYELQLRHRRPSGDYQTLIVRGQPILDESDRTVEVYGIVLKSSSAASSGT